MAAVAFEAGLGSAFAFPFPFARGFLVFTAGAVLLLAFSLTGEVGGAGGGLGGSSMSSGRRRGFGSRMLIRLGCAAGALAGSAAGGAGGTDVPFAGVGGFGSTAGVLVAPLTLILGADSPLACLVLRFPFVGGGFDADVDADIEVDAGEAAGSGIGRGDGTRVGRFGLI